jgi:hypothetical protein
MNVSQETIKALAKSQEAANENSEASFNSLAKYLGWLSKEPDNMSNNCFVGKENHKIYEFGKKLVGMEIECHAIMVEEEEEENWKN